MKIASRLYPKLFDLNHMEKPDVRRDVIFDVWRTRPPPRGAHYWADNWWAREDTAVSIGGLWKKFFFLSFYAWSDDDVMWMTADHTSGAFPQY